MNQLTLNRGIYTISNVAQILGLPASKVRRWLDVYWDNIFSKHTHQIYHKGERRDKIVNFYTLIEFYVYFQLRDNGVSTKKIHKAHSVIANIMKTSFPFANTGILTDGKSILFDNPEIQSIINADDSLQINIREVIELFCHKIDFGENELAEKYWPLGKGKSIVVDPEHQFGQPVIEGTNIQVNSVYNLFKAGEKVKLISSIYELSSQQVKDAISFYQKAA